MCGVKLQITLFWRGLVAILRAGGMALVVYGKDEDRPHLRRAIPMLRC